MRIIAVAAVFASGCAVPPARSLDAREGAVFRLDGGEGGGTPDAGADAGFLDDLARLVLRDGGIASGALAAVYDHRIWLFHPEDQTTYALFDARRFAAFPNDRSFRFVSSRDVASVAQLPAWPQPAVRAFARDAGFWLARPPLDGVSLVLNGNESYHLREDGYGDFAYDFGRADDGGRTFADAGTRNEDYFVWNEPVYLPKGGYVVDVLRDAPDNPVGVLPPGMPPNNLVGVHLGGSYYLYVLHFRQGSIPASIAPGVVLPTGAYLGRAGNSGYSLVPHVHVALLWYDRGLGRSFSVPLEFAGAYLSRSRNGPATRADFAVPRAGDYVSAQPF